ncbi:DUF4912 domain-containing protein [Myxococcaceae bacterium GXIMD 01537]
MDDLKSVTVKYLRALARKKLGRGHSKLRTKVQLIAALAVVVPALAALAKATRKKLGKKKGAEVPAREAGGSAPTAKKKKATAAERKPSRPAPEVKRVEVVNFPPKPRPPARSVKESAPPVEYAGPAREPVPHAAEPLVEGFFVARVMGEGEARRHHLTASAPPAPVEASAEGSPAYGEDIALALPRDPHSLYVTWEFNAATRHRAMEGLESPRAVLRVFDGEALVRELDFALESKGFYIHGLPSGRPYSVEAHFVARDGRSRRIGPPTNRVTLPPEAPSADTSVRFMRVPVEGPAAGQPTLVAGPTGEREHLTWRRVALPGSAGFEEVAETWRERVGSEAPVPRHLEPPARPEGSSEQQAWKPPPSGRGR